MGLSSLPHALPWRSRVPEFSACDAAECGDSSPNILLSTFKCRLLTSPRGAFLVPIPARNPFKHLHLQLSLDRDRNHVVICSLILRRQPAHSPLASRHSAARAFSFTSFTSFASLTSTSSKPFIIRTSKTPLPQLLYNPHLQAPLGSAGNKGLITPLESALTKNSSASLLESALTKRGGILPEPSTFRHSDLVSIHPLYFHTLPNSFALFCTYQKFNPFVFKQFRTLCEKHPGVGGPIGLGDISTSTGSGAKAQL